MLQPPAGNHWIRRWRPRGEAAARLFCVPYAGAGAGLYRNFAFALPDWIELCAIQAPGREDRVREVPFADVHSLSDALLPQIVPLLDRPYAFFGYSVGALIALEIAVRTTRLRKPGPAHLFVCARSLPEEGESVEVSPVLSTEEIRAKLDHMGATPRELLDNREFFEAAFPALRADFEMDRTYRYLHGHGALSCPVTAIGGEGDSIAPHQDLPRWTCVTTGRFVTRICRGDHFFLKTKAPWLLSIVESALIEDLEKR